jgi:NAD(P)-dependent dehydrogenase (short-subunit alcohol dehydrogenase family)
MLTDTNYRSCQKIAEDLNKTYNQTHCTKQTVKVASAKYCDVLKLEEIDGAFKEAKRTYGHDVDIFYNNAAINKKEPLISLSSEPSKSLDAFEETMQVNVESFLANIHYASKVMSKNNSSDKQQGGGGGGGGCILCTGSTTGLLGDMVPSAYSVSKATVIALVRAAAADLARHGVRVNAISPHRVVAPSLDLDENALRQIFPRASDKELDEMRKKYTINRVVTDDDVADAAVYLASDASKGVTGHNLVLDGMFPLMPCYC